MVLGRASFSTRASIGFRVLRGPPDSPLMFGWDSSHTRAAMAATIVRPSDLDRL